MTGVNARVRPRQLASFMAVTPACYGVATARAGMNKRWLKRSVSCTPRSTRGGDQAVCSSPSVSSLRRYKAARHCSPAVGGPFTPLAASAGHGIAISTTHPARCRRLAWPPTGMRAAVPVRRSDESLRRVTRAPTCFRRECRQSGSYPQCGERRTPGDVRVARSQRRQNRTRPRRSRPGPDASLTSAIAPW